jgi:hypothetical protein
MRRRPPRHPTVAARALLAAALAVTAGCGRQQTAVVLLTVTVAGTFPNPASLTVKVVKANGTSSSQTYPAPAGGTIVFPTTLTAELPPSATGMLSFGVTASRADGTTAAGSAGPVLVAAGASATVYVQLKCGGKDCVPAAPPGGGVDAGAPPPNCGNGVLDPGEGCDTAIPPGSPGACPTHGCDDGIACTNDDGSVSGCTVTCSHAENTATGQQDGCCPRGATAAIDPDCSPTCGNGVVDPGETCDTAIAPGTAGACPSAADCTPAAGGCARAKLISEGTCSALCVRTAITVPESDDGCCPPGGNPQNDTDCAAACGDGTRETGETCDVGIPPPQPGSCPVSCDDGDPCTTDLLSGAACQAVCVHDPITAPISGDGCCLPGSTRAADSDCPARCGDGVLEPGESCDPAVAAGPGACPTACPAAPSACLRATLAGDPTTCTAACVTTAVTACGARDGCCPAGCTAAQDPDCSATCGDGVVQAGESCDTAIPAGRPGACPAACADADPCTDDRLLSAGTCQAACVHLPVTANLPGDGCCPAGSNFLLDADCAPVCGDGIVETPVEACDRAVGASCPAACPAAGSCVVAVLRGDPATCSAACVSTPITACLSGDGCCPPGCTALTDADCPIVCGDGAVETGETCDRAITAGLPGACPLTCDDGDACTVDLTSGGAAQCTRACAHARITACLSGDGCCPPGCTAATDGDCAPVCGDGKIEAGETCDPPGTCPTTCPDDRDACTIERLVGDPRTCNAACQHLPITACSGSRRDGCCPTGCTAATDSDC